MNASEFAKAYENEVPTATPLEIFSDGRLAFLQARKEGIEVTTENVAALIATRRLMHRQQREQFEGLMAELDQLVERRNQGDEALEETCDLSMKVARMAAA